MAGKSLAEKINALISAKPDFGSDEEPEETKAKVVEYYGEDDVSEDELQQSKIRRQNVDTLDAIDERYAGKKVSRKDIYSDENDTSEDMESEGSGEDVEDEEVESTLEQSENELESDEEADSQQESQDAESMSDIEEDDYNIDISNSLYKQKDSTIKTMSETNVKAEVEKGNCIRNQLKFWENFLEMRIKLQKCVITSNQMPQHDKHKQLGSNIDFVKKVNETKNKLVLALNNMLQLRELLLKQYPETKYLSTNSKKRKVDKDENTNTNDPMDEEIPSNIEDVLENEKESSIDEDMETAEEPVPRKRLKYNDYEKVLQENHDSYKEYRDSVIKKWNDKTRIATGSLSKGSGQTTLKQIEFAMSEISKLRKKTQLKRSEYNIVGKSLPNEDSEGRRIQEYDPEIYDDDDFYHQLLRDLIEYKSSDVTDPVQLSKQWIQLQNMRRKLKMKIDTRATKGRRVRYNVHNKLVNFMAPITVYDTWTDNAKNELYNSLFGKIKSTEEQIKQ
ncbi:protein AATF [Anoplolepis gracilipes]|uniref:protein AATF n=1 Tax=Anoplolepis gracilipes TaxID=354296 RepID=UPI003B9DECEC